MLKSQAGYGGSKSLSIETKAIWKHRLLKLLSLVETNFHPEPCGVCQYVFSERQHSVNIELLRYHVTKLDLGQSDLLAQLVPLTFIGLSVNQPLMQEGFLHAIQTPPFLLNDALDIVPQPCSLSLSRLPRIQDCCPEQPQVSSLRLQPSQQFRE